MVFAGLAIMVMLRPLRRVCHTVEQQTVTPVPEEVPKASVVLYCKSGSTSLPEMLPDIINQDYPAYFEIIVINEGRDPDIEAYMSGLTIKYANVHYTFTPREGVRNLSRKKLALTLGIKAAVTDVIVHITTDTRVRSPYWLRRMTAPFNDPGTDMVIGYAFPGNDEGAGSRVRARGALISAVRYLSAAIGGKPYRGDGDNLAYRRSMFFAEGAFSSSLNLHYGDDDVFIATAASHSHVASVAIGDEAQVMTVSEFPASGARSRNARYTFTARYCKAPRNGALPGILCWLWLASAVTAVVLDPLAWPVDAAVIAGAFGLWIPVSRAWSHAAELLHARPWLLTVVPVMIARPLRDCVIHWQAQREHNAHYTWQTIREM